MDPPHHCPVAYWPAVPSASNNMEQPTVVLPSLNSSPRGAPTLPTCRPAPPSAYRRPAATETNGLRMRCDPGDRRPAATVVATEATGRRRRPSPADLARSPCCPSRHEPARSQGFPILADNFPNEQARVRDSVGKSPAWRCLDAAFPSHFVMVAKVTRASSLGKFKLPAGIGKPCDRAGSCRLGQPGLRARKTIVLAQ